MVFDRCFGRLGFAALVAELWDERRGRLVTFREARA